MNILDGQLDIIKVRSKEELKDTLDDLVEKKFIYSYIIKRELGSEFATVVFKFNEDYWVDFIVRVRNCED